MMNMMKKTRCWALGLAGLLAAGLMATALAAEPETLDTRFARVSKLAPDFAGAWFDDAGRLNVSVVPQGRTVSDAQRRAALDALARVFGRERMAAPKGDLSRLGGPKQPAHGVVFHAAQYPFARLHGWYRGLGKLSRLGGVLYTDIDERRNTLTVAVADLKKYATLVLDIATDAGIPSSAVTVEEEPQWRFLQAGTSVAATPHNPVPAGVEIGGNGGRCTLGLNVRVQEWWWFADAPAFLTNAHCSPDLGGVDPESFTQPLSDGVAIGTELRDPPFEPRAACPEAVCRFSDAAVVLYNGNVGVLHGRIARTLDWEGQFTINPQNPTFQVTGELPMPMVGDVMDKVGAGTGWTVGKVSLTCINAQVPDHPPGFQFACQSVVLSPYGDMISGVGDSGSPVFVWDLQDGATIAGLLFAGEDNGTDFSAAYIFSPMANVRADLGAMETF